jgi:hypothetical protein
MKYNIRGEKNRATMATRKGNNKSSEDNVTAQCDKYIAEVKDFNTQE